MKKKLAMLLIPIITIVGLSCMPIKSNATEIAPIITYNNDAEIITEEENKEESQNEQEDANTGQLMINFSNLSYEPTTAEADYVICEINCIDSNGNIISKLEKAKRGIVTFNLKEGIYTVKSLKLYQQRIYGYTKTIDININASLLFGLLIIGYVLYKKNK